MKRLVRSMILFALLWTGNAHGQSYTCPERPEWHAAACSVYAAFNPSDNAIPHYLREGRPYEGRYRWWWMRMEGFPTVEIHIWNGHYQNPQWAAEMVARSVSVLPPVVLQALPKNTIVSLDLGSGGGAIYWDQPRERAHAIEFNASFAHENANTLDWGFEELLLHELAHVFDSGLYRIRDNPGWIEATERDGNRRVTEYAGENAREALAETFAVWMAWRRDQARPEPERRLTEEHRSQIMSTISNRGAWIDEQILAAASLPNRQLFGPGDWERASPNQ